MMIMVTPSLKYPSLTFQMLDKNETDAAYYDDRGVAIACFIGAGLVFTFILFCVNNAL